MIEMYLTKEEEKMLKSDREVVQKSMEILVTLGDVFGAKRLGNVTSVHVSGISYKNIGDPGLDFLEEWSDDGAKTCVPTTINPCGMDTKRWREFGISETFAEKQNRIVDALKRMGASESLSCTPYLIGNKPNMDEHIAWAESSAIAFANSILGARTNREGGPTALASAITGKTPIFGYHLDEHRSPTHEIDVKAVIKGVLDYSALGYCVGEKLGRCIPIFKGLKNPKLNELKALGAGLAASGAIAIYHIYDFTPKANEFTGSNGYEKIDVEKGDLVSTSESLSIGEMYEHICIGCPHCSIQEISEIANRVAGKRLKRELWIFTSSIICEQAKRMGYYKVIEEAGGKVINDTCMVVAPMIEMGVQGAVTNSCKAAHYIPNTCKIPGTLKSLDECIEAAVGG
jgi:predicted aconitase